MNFIQFLKESKEDKNVHLEHLEDHVLNEGVSGAVHSINFLRSLRERGYKTFDPIINEHYDTIDNDDERMMAIVAEIERLSKFTESEWIEFTRAVKDIVEYNAERLRNTTEFGMNKSKDFVIN